MKRPRPRKSAPGGSKIEARGVPGSPRGAPGGPGGPPDAPWGSKWGLPGAPRGPLGALLAPPEALPWPLLTALGGSWRHRGRSRGASGGLLALSWGRLEPWDLILEPFFFPEALCFRVLRHRSRNRHRLLVFSFGNSGSTWALALESWACALESCALARGSWALAWASALGSWALTLGFRLWGLRLFSSGASALRSWALAQGS